MIQAMWRPAETLEIKRQPLVYRVHDAPSLAKQETLREFLATLDLSLVKGGNLRSNHFNGILSQAVDKPYETMVNEMVLRSQSQAIYSPENIGHFGLNLIKYAHFTSPIRRYADLIVHRALVGTLGLGEGGITPAEEAALNDIAAEISTFERRAMAAERDTVDRLIAHHLSGRVNEEFDGRISGVTKAGLFVTLPAYGADGFVPISTLGRDYSSMTRPIRPFPAKNRTWLSSWRSDPRQTGGSRAARRRAPLRDDQRRTQDADGNALLPQVRPPGSQRARKMPGTRPPRGKR